MKFFYYILAGVFGLFGLLALLRFLETLAFGGRIFPVQLLIGIIGIGIGVVCVKKGRTT